MIVSAVQALLGIGMALAVARAGFGARWPSSTRWPAIGQHLPFGATVAALGAAWAGTAVVPGQVFSLVIVVLTGTGLGALLVLLVIRFRSGVRAQPW